MAAADWLKTNAPYTSNLLQSVPMNKWLGQKELMDFYNDYQTPQEYEIFQIILL